MNATPPKLGAPRTMFEVCSAGTPVGMQFFTQRFGRTGNRGPNTRCHEAVLVNPPATPGGRLPDARENRGLDLRALGVRVAPVRRHRSRSPFQHALEKRPSTDRTTGI